MKKRTYWMWVAVLLAVLMSAPAYATETWEIGNIDNSPIGQATPAAGSFTTLTASSTITPATLTASKPVFTDASKNLVSTGTLGVDQGGTGATTLTDHGILLGSGTGAVTPLGSATNGQIPIGSTGADPVLAALTEGEAIDVTNGAGTITLACEDASESNKGVMELATDAETVTGTSDAVVCTPGNITAKMAAPGAIGGTTPAAGSFTTLKQTTGAADGAIPISDATGAFTLTASTGTGAPVRATLPSIAGMANTGRLTGFKVNKADEAYNPSALTADYIIAFTSLTAARACTISTEDEDIGTATQPRVMIVKDESGDADSYNITISLESGGTIDGNATYTLNQPYESVMLYINGTNAFTVAN